MSSKSPTKSPSKKGGGGGGNSNSIKSPTKLKKEKSETIVEESQPGDDVFAPEIVQASPGKKLKKPKAVKLHDPNDEEGEAASNIVEVMTIKKAKSKSKSPGAQKVKKAKKLQQEEVDEDDDDALHGPYDAKLDKKYQKQDPRGHVQMRPSRYVGSVQVRKRATWVAIPWADTFEGQQAKAAALLTESEYVPMEDDPEQQEDDPDDEEYKEEKKVKKTNLKAVVASASQKTSATGAKQPLHCVLQRIDMLSSRGFLTIFREPLNNALDNSSKPGSRITYIKIDVDPVKGRIVIENDGPSVNITQKSTEHKVYYPELVFAQMHTSTNFDDSQERKTGGRHGEGVKLTSILSTRSSVEINDPDSDRNYTQVFEDHLKIVHPPKFVKSKKNKHYIRYTYTPDLAIFGMEEIGFNDEIMGMLRANACEAAATSARKNVKVSFNGEWLSIRSFTEYAGACVGGMGGFADDEVDEAPLEAEEEPAEDEEEAEEKQQSVEKQESTTPMEESEEVVAGTIGAAAASPKKRKAKKKQDPRLKGLSKDQKLAHSKIQNEEVARAVRLNQLMPYTVNEDHELVIAVKPRETTLRKNRNNNNNKKNKDAEDGDENGEDGENELESQEMENDWKEPWANSFVNHVPTTKGGTHVDLYTKTISVALATEMRKKYKKQKALITPALIRQHMWLFLNVVSRQ